MTTAVENKIDKPNESFRDKILRKCGESVEMKEKFFEKYADDIERLSHDMAKRFSDGKKLLTMGNGGSLCDALHFAVEFTHPIIEKRVAFPVVSLMTDIATMIRPARAALAPTTATKKSCHSATFTGRA